MHERSPRSHVCRRVPDPCGSTEQTQDIHEASTSLETLGMDSNHIGDEGASALADALKATHALGTNCSSAHRGDTLPRDLLSCKLRRSVFCVTRQVTV